jgi:hypothetical protein
MDFTGKYEGTLWYGDGYSHDQGAELTFQMEIEEADNSFSGIANDTGGTGMSPDEAIVTGVISDKLVSFDKVYKHYHYSDEEGNTIVDEKSEGLPILYNGIFNQETGFYEGKWKYNVVQRYWILFTKPVEIGSGTFKLKKA